MRRYILRVVHNYTTARGAEQYLTYSTSAWNCPNEGCDHIVNAETRSKAHFKAVREHKDKCLARR